MIFNTFKIKNPSYNAILSVVFLFILTFGLFSSLSIKKALASTSDYIDNISYTDNGLSFHVKTTFSIDNYYIQNNDLVCSPSYFGTTPYNGSPPTYYYVPYFTILPDDFTYPFVPQTFTFYAAQTYHVKLVGGRHDYAYCGYGTDILYGSYDNLAFISNDNPILYYPYPDTLTITYFGDNLTIQKQTFPSVSISFPHNNDEIAGAFYLDGSYSVPSLTDYSRLLVWFTTPDNNTYPNAYYDLPATTGSFHILISNLPAGYYYLNFVFTGNKTYYYPDKIYIHIVNDIPEILSTGETIPSTPAFGYTSPDSYYVVHSNYSTSTALFNELSNSIGALIQSVGNSLSSFAGKFTLTDAQNTATMLAGSVSTIRTYGNNLNSFFGSLPVSQILFLYLIIFIAVIVFRLIKNLVNLIKP